MKSKIQDKHIMLSDVYIVRFKYNIYFPTNTETCLILLKQT